MSEIFTYNEYFSLLDEAQKQGMPVRFFFFLDGQVTDAQKFIESSTDTLMNTWRKLTLYLRKIPHKDFIFLFARSYEDLKDVYESVIDFIKEDTDLTFEDLDDFQTQYSKWSEELTQDVIQEKVAWEQNSEFIKSLTAVKNPVKIENIVNDQLTTIFYLDVEEDPFELLNVSKASRRVPFIQRVDESGKSQIKLYLPSDQFEEIDYNYLIPVSKTRPNILYFYILINEKKINENSYVLAEFSLDDNGIRVKYPTIIEEKEGTDFIKKQIESVFDRKIRNYEHVEYMGYVDFEVKEFSEDVFYYLLMTDLRFRNFFINEEKISWASAESKFKIDYRGFRIPLKYIDQKSHKTISVSFNIEGMIGNVFRINIAKAQGNLEYQSFLSEMRYLLSYIQQKYGEVRNLFKKYISVPETQTVRKVKAVNKLYPRKLDLTVQKAREIFKGRSRSIQCRVRPIIIEEDDVKDWENLTLPNGEKRTILTFPPPPKNEQERKFFNPEIDVPQLYVCPDDNLPYPILSVIKGSEKHMYPIAPKCNSSSNVKSLNLYEIRAKGIDEEGGFKENITKTLSVKRSFLERGELPQEIKDFLKKISPSHEYYRYGSDHGPFALISAIYQAVTEELEHNINERKAEYREIKSALIDFAICAKQELFDETLEEIEAKLEDEDYPLDSLTFYHPLEEYYGVNIFVLVQKERNFYFEVPRSANLSIRVLSPSRPSIILLKRYYQSDMPSYDFLHNFEEEAESSLVIDAYRQSVSNMVWDKDEKGERVCRIFPYDAYGYDFLNTEDLDWKQVLGKYRLVSQFVDGYGKTRIINIDLDGENEDYMSVFVLPTQPLHLEIDQTIYPQSYDKIISVFGNKPSMISQNGLYFNVLDFHDGVFVPTISINENPTTERGVPFSVETTDSEYYSYRRLKRISNLLLECIEWCWRNDGEGLEVEEWLDTYITSDNSEENIDIVEKNIKILFPSIKEYDTKLAIKAISSWWNDTVCANDAINLYPDLVEKIVPYFIELDRKTKSYYPYPPQKYVSTETRSNLIVGENSIILFDIDTYWNYVQGIKHKNTMEIKSTVDENDFFPQLYKSEDDRIYIIQPTKRGKLEEALYICKEWKDKSINIGESSETIERDLVKYGLYYQTENGFVRIEDHTEGSRDYFEVLHLNGNYYAMLQIL